jgi:hypothetical protein
LVDVFGGVGGDDLEDGAAGGGDGEGAEDVAAGDGFVRHWILSKKRRRNERRDTEFAE